MVAVEPDLVDVGRAEALLRRSSVSGAGGSSRPRKNGISGCIPAVVEQRRAVVGARDRATPTGSRRWPFYSKNARKPSRSSAVVRMTVILGTASVDQRLADRAGADDRVALVEHRGLAGRDAVRGLVEPEPEAVVASRRRRAATAGER